MSAVTQILDQIQQGDPSAAAQLLPLVYDELRKLAAQKLAQEKPGQTLEATARVHEAYLRLVQGGAPHPQPPSPEGRGEKKWDGPAPPTAPLDAGADAGRSPRRRLSLIS